MRKCCPDQSSNADGCLHQHSANQTSRCCSDTSFNASSSPSNDTKSVIEENEESTAVRSTGKDVSLYGRDT